MNPSSYTKALLDDIERRIDPEVEEDYRAQWEAFWSEPVEDQVFRPRRKKTSQSELELKSICINDALHDYDLMLCSELVSLSKKLSSAGAALGVRANYGTGILSSLFGAEVYEMPRETNTLPTTRVIADSDVIRALPDKGIPDLYRGFGKDVFFFGEYCSEVFEHYPKIKKYVDIYHPDTQGPLDIVELLWGGGMFYEMYDDPEVVHSVLRLVTDTYKAFLEKWDTIVAPRKGLSVHWGLMHRGNIMLRLDSAMNISEDFYNEFSKPYDREVLDHFGGGCLHFCGRGDHYIASACELENLYGIQLSQPHLNDMKKILQAVGATKKRIIGLSRAAEHFESVSVCKGLVSG